MKDNDTTLTVVKDAEIEKPVTVDKEKLKKATETKEKFSALIKDKKYILDLSFDQFSKLVKYIEEDVQWEFMECQGIVELHKELVKAGKQAYDTKKPSKFNLHNVVILALAHFLSKNKGRGIKSALSSKEMYDSCYTQLAVAVTMIKADNTRLETLERQVEAFQNGMDVEITEKSKKALEEVEKMLKDK